MNENSTKIVRILLHAVILRLDVLLIKESQNTLLQLSAAFSRDDLDQFDLLLDRLVDDAPQRRIDVPTTVVNVVKIEGELHDNCGAFAVTPVTASSTRSRRESWS